MTDSGKVIPYYTDHSRKTPARFLSLSDLRGLLDSPSIGPKAQAAVFTPYLSKRKTKEVAEDAEFHALIMDHDHDDLSKEQLQAIYRGHGLPFMAFTTSYHMQEKNGVVGQRWKVVIPFQSPISARQFNELAKGAASLLKTDEAQANIQQIAYAPNKLTDDAPYQYIIDMDKPLLDITSNAFAIKAVDEGRRIAAVKAKPKPRDRKLVNGSAGIIDKVCEQLDLSAELEAWGHIWKGKSYLSPQSKSGVAGVYILAGTDGKERCYSHHGPDDPLSNLNHDGHSLDVFDVVCLRDYGGDVSKAVAGLAPLVDPDGQKQRQREYSEKKEKPAKQLDFPLIPVGELINNVTPPDWLIDGLIERDTLGQLFGKSGTGKSFVAIDWACSVATGTECLGKQVSQGPVIYIAGEGHGGLRRRFKAWSLHHGISLDRAPIFTSKTAAALIDEDSAKAVNSAVNEIADEHGSPALIIVDTLARNLGPGDENSNADVSKFINVLDSIRLRHQSTIFIVHHTGHQSENQNRARGASSLRAAVDHDYKMQPRSDGLMLKCFKMKEGELPDNIAITLKQVEVSKDEKGEPVYSAVVVGKSADGQSDEVAVGDQPKVKAPTKSQQWAIDNFKETARELGTLNAEGKFEGLHLERWRASFYAASTQDTQKAKNQAFNRARKGLVEDGWMKVDEDVYRLAGLLGDVDTQKITEIICEREAKS